MYNHKFYSCLFIAMGTVSQVSDMAYWFFVLCRLFNTCIYKDTTCLIIEASNKFQVTVQAIH